MAALGAVLWDSRVAWAMTRMLKRLGRSSTGSFSVRFAVPVYNTCLPTRMHNCDANGLTAPVDELMEKDPPK